MYVHCMYYNYYKHTFILIFDDRPHLAVSEDELKKKDCF